MPHRQLVKIVIFFGVVGGLALAWRLSPLGEWLDSHFLATVQTIRGAPWAIPAAVGLFVLGALVMVPQTALVFAIGAIFPGPKGFLIAYGASLIASSATYLVGRELGRGTLEALAGGRIERLSRYLGHRGIRTVIVLNVVPIAPYTLINLVAGASHISFRDFMLGTVIGLWPFVLAVTLFGDRITAFIESPDAETFGWLAAAAGFALAMMLLLRKTAGETVEEWERE